ncbi:GNAT family N-acetyltransferase [Sinorhizobium medicae]|uniref:GNAT family N-acetyltransferase n=1 Tax=Sinorhizobium medicae TaxID=110321 RepID=UPI002AF6A444|nr:GNAT family N-acetyltransferase [Sinorhizobium medicae]WQO46873.1 GNAT family N-acetyltransferase [Sinorhizobium medicae]WQO64003.1 GNAT family N-acetyltransferase [Sinorhizobium medicae]WQO74227.1 GNAT family N-acetyltransferase [Sinorhizobium medicae]WQO93496.1 GNAT family N-acetyltransferase [Sinorhizobium medicae]
MTAGATLRPAKRSEAAELAILIDIASHGFASWLWYGGVLNKSAETALEHGRNLLRRDDEPGAWQDAVVAEIGGEIAGLSVSYGIDASTLTLEPKHPVLAPLIHLQRQVVGHWFIDSLGVYRHHRGKGMGRALLQNEISRAGQAPVSLITESHNETAQALYRMNGFEEVARAAAVPLFEDSRKHDWVLFTRNVA